MLASVARVPMSATRGRPQARARNHEGRARVGADHPYTAAWADADLVALGDLAASLRMRPADLLLVLASESGLRPDARNPAGSSEPIAAGLNQLTAASDGATGLSEPERWAIADTTVAHQLPIVGRMFRAIPWTRDGREYPDAGVIYLANFAPGRMSRGTSDDTVVYDAADGVAYSRNAAFDRDGRGSITIGDLRRRLDDVAAGPIYREAIARLRDVGVDDRRGDAGGARLSGASVGLIVFTVVAMVGVFLGTLYGVGGSGR